MSNKIQSCFVVCLALLIGALEFTACDSNSSANTSTEKDSGTDSDTDSGSGCYSVPEERDDGWQVGNVNDYGIDEDILCEMMEAIDEGIITRVDSIAIVKDGVLVFDELIRTQLDEMDFGINTDLEVHILQSATKSFASALVGIAIEQGYINSVQDRILDYFPEYESYENYDERKENWTIEDFLTMQSGLDWDEWSAPFDDESNSLGYVYTHFADYVKALFDWPMLTEPGTVFSYCSICSVALGALVENAAGIPLEDFADEYLFTPLQIETDIWIFTPTGLPHTGGGLMLSSRDMAKFGQLYLLNGNWDGEDIFPGQWVEVSTQEHVSFSEGFGLGRGYGYQWWLDDLVHNEQPQNIFSAKGYGGQTIFVWPEEVAVVVFTGSNWELDEGGDRPYLLMRDYIIPAFN